MREIDIGADPAKPGPHFLGANHETQEQAAEEGEDEKHILRPVAEVSDLAGLSRVRIAHMLKAGRIEGELRPLESGPGRPKWYTSVAAVEKYQSELLTPAEYGRKGNLIAGRGRPKSS